MGSGGSERRLAAILSADAAGYGRLMAEDEEATVRLLTECRRLLSDKIGQFGGRVVDAPGDNVLAEFRTATGAVECAVEIQRALPTQNTSIAPGRRMEFRIGVHLGEVHAEGERIYGDDVKVAARLETLAQPGGVCLSEAVHSQIQSKLELAYEDLGEQRLEDIPTTVRAYRIVRGG